MDMEGALRARLLADATAAAIVGQRVYWVDRPQSSVLPDVTFSIIGDDRAQDMKGFVGMRQTRVRADCRATSYAGAKALSEAVIAALVGDGTFYGIRFGRAEVEGPQDIPERTETQLIHRKIPDLLIWHAAA